MQPLGLLGALVLLLALGCGDAAQRNDNGRSSVELTVSAASDLRFAFEEIGALFERETGIDVTFNFGSTGHLAQQIEQGAPVDVFAAADVSFIERLADRGFIAPDTQALYARGFIVLWTRDDSPFEIKEVEDLLDPRVRRVSIANPSHAPYGIAAREALQTAGIWEEVGPKLVLGENVNQAFQFAQTGNVDVGVIALSLGIVAEGGRFALVPQELYSPVDQAIGVVGATGHPGEARAFTAFINGPIGRPVMNRYGFALPEGWAP